MSDSALAVAFMLEVAKCSILTDSYPTHYHIKRHSKSLPLPKMFILQAIVKDLISSCNALSNETIAIFFVDLQEIDPSSVEDGLLAVLFICLDNDVVAIANLDSCQNLC